ncbi:MAG: phosphatidylglycerophosphatase A [Deltaproteobacteria bacterium]|nr:phosphatidylglycerophosphatase A [Deltaproteobacteria bacterium]
MTHRFSVGETRAIEFPHSVSPKILRGPEAESIIETKSGDRPAQPRAFVALALATGLGIGFAPFAPGTFGSLLAAAIFVLLSQSIWGVIGVWGASVGLGVWAAGEAQRAFGREDDSRIVIDEIAGQLLALAPLLALPAASRGNFFALVTAFVAFRLFDIWKPGPVGAAEKRFQGGLGVMADDLVAGALAAAVVAALVAGGVLA